MSGSWTGVNVSYAKFDGEFLRAFIFLLEVIVGVIMAQNGQKKRVLTTKMTIWSILGCSTSFNAKILLFSERAYFADEMG